MVEPKNRKENKKKFLRFFFAAMTICAVASLLGDLLAWLIHAMGGISFSVDNAASIGIIGGADGPTSIFITSSTAPFWHIAFKFLIMIIGILGWRYLKRK